MLKNRSKVKVKGLNQERAINNISKTVNIYNFKRYDKSLSEFEIDLKDSKKIKKLLENEGLALLSIKNSGLAYIFKEILGRLGIIIGLIFVLFFYIIQYGFVLKIEVWGGESHEQAEVRKFVQENMTSHFKSNISTEELEIKVRNNFDYVSSVSIAIIGQSLIVNLNPTILPDEMEGEFKPIVSEYNGLITKINLIQGTLNCKVGDIVQEGDILVLPYTIDSDGNMYEVQPRAEIYADVWISSTVSHYDYKIVQSRTGKTITTSQVLLGGLVIYDNSPSVSFADYECETSTKILTKNLILPLYLKKTIYYEIAIEEIYQPFDEVKDTIIEQAHEKVLIFFDKNDIIINENVTITEGGGCHNVNYTLTVNKNIGES